MEEQAKEVKNLADTLFDDKWIQQKAGAILRSFSGTSFASQQVLDKDPTVWLYKAIEVKKRKEGISLKSGFGK